MDLLNKLTDPLNEVLGFTTALDLSTALLVGVAGVFLYKYFIYPDMSYNRLSWIIIGTLVGQNVLKSLIGSIIHGTQKISS